MNMDKIWAQLTIEERELLQSAPDQFVPVALVPRLQQLGAIPGGPAHRPTMIGSVVKGTKDGPRYVLSAEFRSYIAEQTVE